MATYSNIGIKLITTGDESGTWGDTTNTNFSDILDEAIAGAVTYNISSDADVTLTVSDGSSSDARHAVIKFTSTTLTATRTVTFAPDTLQKTWLVINSTTGGQSLTFKQGSAGATVTVANGESAWIYSDGAGATNGAIVKALDSFTNTKITTGTLNATTLDLTNLEVTNIKAKDGTAAATIADSTGVVTVNSLVATTADVNGGTIDGTTIGGSSAAAGTFTTATATTGNITTVNATTVDATNVEVTNVKAKDGTAAITIADSTGNVGIGVAAPTIPLQIGKGGGGNPATSGTTQTYGIARIGSGGAAALDVGTYSAGQVWMQGVNVTNLATNYDLILQPNSGNVGIGVTPTVNLDVKNAGGNCTISAQYGTGTKGQLIAANNEVVLKAFNGTNDVLTFYTGASERMRIDSSGNVGIGTASPASIGGVLSTVANGNTGVGYFRNLATSGITSDQLQVAVAQSTSLTNFYLARFYTNVSASPAVMAHIRGDGEGYFAGNVGIGTASPRSTLDVSGSIYTSWSDTNFIGMQFGNDPSDYRLGLLPVSSQRDLQIYCKSNDGFGVSGITFHTGSTPSERMRIDSSGNVGIGTAPLTAGTRLSVLGGRTGLVANSEPYSLYVQYGSGKGQYYIGATDSATPDLVFSNVAGTERMRLDSSGNVGIGGTAAAYEKISVSGTYPTSSNASQGLVSKGTIPSGATSSFVGYYSVPSTQAAAFTCASLYHFLAGFGTKGASSAITNQYGFLAGGDLTGATNNYGFYSDIASGANRWNFYAAGTARNYFAGRTDVGKTRIVETNPWNGVQIDSTGEVTIADGGTITLCSTSCASMMIHVYQTNNGNGGVFFATYATAVTKVAGDGDATDTGSLFAVYKSINSHTVTLKNRSGAARNYIISIFASLAS